MEDLLTLKGALTYLVAGGGAGILASWILSKWTWYQRWTNDFWKMVIALLLPGPIAFGAYLAMLGMLYAEAPVGARGWIETTYAVMAAAIVGQLAHKFKQGRK